MVVGVGVGLDVVGNDVGSPVGNDVGPPVGNDVGSLVVGRFVGLFVGVFVGRVVGRDRGAVVGRVDTSVKPQGSEWEKLGSPHMFFDPPGQISGGQPALHAPHFTRAHVHTWLAGVGNCVGTRVDGDDDDVDVGTGAVAVDGLRLATLDGDSDGDSDVGCNDDSTRDGAFVLRVGNLVGV